MSTGLYYSHNFSPELITYNIARFINLEYSYTYTVKQVIAVRTDLDMSTGKLAGQVAHAAVKVSHKITKEDVLKSWQNKGAPKIIVEVNSEEEINKLKEKAHEQNLPYSVISDLGHTELEPNTVTTIGIGPAEKSDIDKVTGDLSLL
jgi:peptidyl-tRNA hydrolase